MWGRVRRAFEEERKEARSVERLDAFSMIALPSVISDYYGTAVTRVTYRSMIVIRGATRPEALAAAVKSEVSLHEK